VTRSLEEQIRSLEARVGELSTELSSSQADEEVAQRAVAELVSAVEELTVAGEELANQAEALIGERGLAEQERQYFEGLFVSGPAASLVTDASARITTANQPAARLLGISAHFLPGKPLAVFLDAGGQSAMFRLMERARRNPNQTFRDDLTLRARGGETNPIAAIVAAAPAADGTREFRWLLDEGIVSRRFEDLTPAERSIRSASVRLDVIVDSASDGIVSVDHDDRIVLFNRAAQKIFGWSAEEVMGRPLELLLPHEGDEDPAIGLTTLRPRDERGPVSGRRRSGECFPAEVTIARAHVDGHLISTAIVRDVTERERVLRELLFAEEFNRRIIETVGSLVVVIDPTRRVLVFNDACEQATGFRFEDVVGCDIIDLLVPPEERATVRRSLDELARGRRTSSLEHHWMTSFGGRRLISWSHTVLVDDRQQVTHIVSTGTDVTHQRELEEQLATAQHLETLGQLASGIAHDFNNVLSIMRGHLELLADTEDLPAPARARVDALDAVVGRAVGIMANLTTLNRNEPEHAQVISLNEATQALARLLVDVIGPDIALGLSLDATDDRVSIDPIRFDQALINLVLNACDAVDGRGLVRIRTTTTSNGDRVPGVRVAVTDTGTGMDDATLSRAFEPFFTTKAPGVGSGLGLATTRRIIEAAGGSVSASSTLGKGTTVELWIPLVDAQVPIAPATAPPSTRSADDDRTRATVLVVDDEPQMLAVARDILEAVGHRVLVAPSAAQAIELVERERGDVDLVLTDVVMPDVGGGELAAELVRSNPDLPVVFMTAYRAGFRPPDGSRRVLRKPFGRRALIDAVQGALEDRHAPSDRHSSHLDGSR